MHMLLRRGFKMDWGLGVVEAVAVEEEEEEEEGEGEGEEVAGVGGRGWAVWMISGGRNARAVGERRVGIMK